MTSTLGACTIGRSTVSPEFRGSSMPTSGHHQLHVVLDPPARTLTAEDRMTLTGPLTDSSTVAFYLADHLTVETVSITVGSDQRIVAFHRQKPRLPQAPFARRRYATFEEMTRYQVDLPAGQTHGQPLVLTVRYNGHWPETPDHDEAINDRGAQLTGAEGWYPLWPDALFTYDLAVDHPADWTVVSAGQRAARTGASDRPSTTWSMTQPTESIDLIAGPYVVTTRQVDHIELSTYFFTEEASLAPTYLDAAVDYLARYSRLLGPYPFPKLAVVETPAPIGAATPSLVLLGRPLVRRHYTQPYGLGHEIVHAWIGNSVMADEAQGNWTEALTTYVANYYTVEEEQGESAARQQRRKMLLQYAAQAPPERDYPLMRFLHNDSQTDAAIGYQKGAFVFHLLRRTMGDDDFFAALRDLTDRYRGKRAGWNDLRLLFEARSGQPLDWFFRQWVLQAGAPKLVIERVEFSALPAEGDVPEGTMIKVHLRQSTPPFRIPVTVHVETDARILEKSIWMEQERVVIETAAAGAPLRVLVDPEWQLLRRLDRDELPPMLNLTLTEPSFAILPSDRAGTDVTRLYQTIADGARERHTAQAARPIPATGDQPAAWLVLGGPEENRATAELAHPPEQGATRRLPPGIQIEQHRFSIGGQSYTTEGHALLLSFRDPARQNRPVTLFYGLSPAAIAPLVPLLFYHGWDSYVVFDKGRAIATGELPAARSPLRWTPAQQQPEAAPEPRPPAGSPSSGSPP